ncbi:MAG: CotH kinase family protein [Solobacterium sp.]|nr:CotH kinase family protein [Solobacterium sp.]
MKHRHALFRISLVVSLAMTVFASGCQSRTPDTPVWKDNGLPVVYLTIDEEEFRKVNESEEHEYRAPGGTVRVADTDDDVGIELELEYLRGRGHGTWSADKKPYKFKLKEKADLLNMGENKHWVLLANRYDPTLIRNLLVYDIAGRMGLPYTPECRPVDLVVNGEYWGSYLLSEDVRINKNRIAIDELKPEDTDEPALSGGYLLALNPDENEPPANVFLTDHMVRLFCEEPEFSEAEESRTQQRDYIVSYMQRLEDAIFAEDFKDENGTYYGELMDLQSAADYWWIQEFSQNFDAFTTSSTYMFKERDGKLFWGPVWDFDLSFDEGYGTEEGLMYTKMPWIDRLRGNEPEFQQMLRERWEVLNTILMQVTEPGGILDGYKDTIEKSWRDDAERWPLISEEGETISYDFTDVMAYLRERIDRRRTWINEHIDEELTRVFYDVTFLAEDGEYAKKQVRRGTGLSDLPAGPEKEGFVFTGWVYENGESYDQTPSREDVVLYPAYTARKDAVIAEEILLPAGSEQWGEIHQKDYGISFAIRPEESLDRNVHWISSDPETAEIREYNTVRMHKTGTVTITGSLNSGASVSFTLHIYDKRYENPPE